MLSIQRVCRMRRYIKLTNSDHPAQKAEIASQLVNHTEVVLLYFLTSAFS